MEAQHTSANIAPLTVRCCSQHSRGAFDDETDPATRVHMDSATVSDAVQHERSAGAETGAPPDAVTGLATGERASPAVELHPHEVG
jgi:hypothetical protein